MLQGHPITASLPEDLNLGERFWYWRGRSGTAYIHSIYPADFCPPLPGAVYVAVRSIGGIRRACAVGRFSRSPDGGHKEAVFPEGCNEIHVHLLAREEEAAEQVRHDLAEALAPAEPVPAMVRRITGSFQRERLAA